MSQDLASTSRDLTFGFSYNNASQVTQRTLSNDSYSYFSQTLSKAYTRDGLNRYQTVGGVTYGYDGRGNMTSDGMRTFTYDYENHLLSVSGGAAPASFTYGPNGRLLTSTSGGVTTRYLYDGDKMVGEYSGSTLLRRYVHGAGIDEPLVWYEGAALTDRRWLHTDHQGSVIASSNGYAGNDPFNRVDPTGEFVQLAPLLVAAAVGAAGGAVVEGYRQWKQDGSIKLDSRMLSAVGKGAVAGVGALVGGAGFVAVASTAGASTTAVGTASTIGPGYGAGLATLAGSQAVDIAVRQKPGSADEVALEALGAAGGAMVGAGFEEVAKVGSAALAGLTGQAASVIGKVTGTVAKVGGKAGGKVAGEAGDAAASSMIENATKAKECPDRSRCE